MSQTTSLIKRAFIGRAAFEKPESKNAATTVLIMGALALSMFSGSTALALTTHARAYADGNPAVISQVAETVWGGSLLYYAFQAATAAILILAANTAFNGFPTLASILARDRLLPRQLHNHGDRLAFSNGIVLLALSSGALIVAFDASIEKLIQLYIVGVFTSFTKIHAPTLRALAYARATRPQDLTALTAAVSDDESRQLQADWDLQNLAVPLTIVASPYREITRPVLDHIAGIRRSSPRDVITVYIPEYDVGHWWEQLLHNQSALRLKGRLLYQAGVMVTSAPCQLHSSRKLTNDSA